MYLGVDENFLYPLITFSTESKKSFSVIDFLRPRMAYIPASVQTERISAPVVLGHILANKSKRMSSSERGPSAPVPSIVYEN